MRSFSNWITRFISPFPSSLFAFYSAKRSCLLPTSSSIFTKKKTFSLNSSSKEFPAFKCVSHSKWRLIISKFFFKNHFRQNFNVFIALWAPIFNCYMFHFHTKLKPFSFLPYLARKEKRKCFHTSTLLLIIHWGKFLCFFLSLALTRNWKYFPFVSRKFSVWHCLNENTRFLMESIILIFAGKIFLSEILWAQILLGFGIGQIYLLCILKGKRKVSM